MSTCYSRLQTTWIGYFSLKDRKVRSTDTSTIATLTDIPGLSYSREAKLLCKKVVAFFQLLAESQGTGVRRLGVTQELLSLVTGLAHYLKLLIRICLQGSLKLERETGSDEGLHRFLSQVNSLEEKLELEGSVESAAEFNAYISRTADTCPVCDKPVEDKCLRQDDRVFHTNCMVCQKCGVDVGEHREIARWSEAQKLLLCRNDAEHVPDAQAGFVQVSRLRQYVHLLKVAHARLLATLRTSGALPHTSGKPPSHALESHFLIGISSDDPNLSDYNSNHGHRLTPTGEDGPPLLRADSRSKSYNGTTAAGRQSGSYEDTLGNIRRLRSTRMDKHLSQTMKQARTSTILDRPEGNRPSSAGEGANRNGHGMSIVHDRDVQDGRSPQLTLGVNSLALDDIPRLVAAEQAREQRPNAARYGGDRLIGKEPKPKLVNGHRRDFSGGNELNEKAGEAAAYKAKRYFSELSALEYFIVRHLAVLSMEPLLEGQFNQEELLDLIEQRRPTFWGKFGQVFKGNDKGKAAGRKKGVFGKSLEHVVERDGAESTDGVGPGTLRVPAIVQDAVSAMRTMDMSVEGVFRKNGNIRRLNEMAAEIDAKGGDSVDLTRENPVQVAALLKKFLRELPDPVLTYKLHKLFITGSSMYVHRPYSVCY